MPPKPFNPPRPRASPTSKKAGRPKATTSSSKPRKSLTNTTTNKSKPSGVRKLGREEKRISTASVASRFSLPSLSPMSGEEDNAEEDGEEEDDPFAEDINTSISLSKSKAGKRKSFSAAAVSKPSRADSDIEMLSPSGSREKEDRNEHISEALLSVLLQQGFKQDNTRLSKDATRAVGKYMETFVREALARAAWRRSEMEEGEGVLEVEDLEKEAVQLVLDF